MMAIPTSEIFFVLSIYKTNTSYQAPCPNNTLHLMKLWTMYTDAQDAAAAAAAREAHGVVVAAPPSVVVVPAAPPQGGAAAAAAARDRDTPVCKITLPDVPCPPIARSDSAIALPGKCETLLCTQGI